MFIMDNGESMRRMALELLRIKKLDIVILDHGKRIRKMDMVESKL